MQHALLETLGNEKRWDEFSCERTKDALDKRKSRNLCALPATVYIARTIPELQGKDAAGSGSV
jgi:hypothetical protein